jgi:tyrosyl-tRNA synthetase
MGKTGQCAVWLNADRLSPYDFWQYWRNTEDGDGGRFLRLFTELPLDEIARLEALEGAEINDAKKILATEVTKLAHGEEAALAAAETARRTFEEGAAPQTLPTFPIDIDSTPTVTSALVLAGFAASIGEAKRLIKGGGVRVNDAVVSDEQERLGSGHVSGEGVIKLSAGKKRHALLKPSN